MSLIQIWEIYYSGIIIISWFLEKKYSRTISGKEHFKGLSLGQELNKILNELYKLHSRYGLNNK